MRPSPEDSHFTSEIKNECRTANSNNANTIEVVVSRSDSLGKENECHTICTEGLSLSGSDSSDRDSGVHTPSSSEELTCPDDQENTDKSDVRGSKKVTFCEGESNVVFFTPSSDGKRAENKSRKTTQGSTRLCEMYERGKNKIIEDRERYKKSLQEEGKLYKPPTSPPRLARRLYSVSESHTKGKKHTTDNCPQQECKRSSEIKQQVKNKMRLSVNEAVKAVNNVQKHLECPAKDSSNAGKGCHAIAKRSIDSMSSSGTVSSIRLSEMYELGRKKITVDRERFKKHLEKERQVKPLPRVSSKTRRQSASSSKSKGNQFMRSCDMYEAGKHKIRSDRERCMKEKANHNGKSKGHSSMRNSEGHDRLYALSKQRQVLGKERRDTIEKNKSKFKSFPSCSSDRPTTKKINSAPKELKGKDLNEAKSIKKIPKNKARWNRLYELSKPMQKYGNDRRHEIEKKNSCSTKWLHY